MIARIITWFSNRHMRRGFAQLERTTRASTHLTERYEKRRVREIRIARERFQNGTAGRKLA